MWAYFAHGGRVAEAALALGLPENPYLAHLGLEHLDEEELAALVGTVEVSV